MALSFPRVSPSHIFPSSLWFVSFPTFHFLSLPPLGVPLTAAKPRSKQSVYDQCRANRQRVQVVRLPSRFISNSFEFHETKPDNLPVEGILRRLGHRNTSPDARKIEVKSTVELEVRIVVHGHVSTRCLVEQSPTLSFHAYCFSYAMPHES